MVSEPGSPSSPFQQLSGLRDRLVIEFESNQTLDFLDAAGRLVRMRYEPEYRRISDSGGLPFGLLDGTLKTPDFALEVYGTDGDTTPKLIAILDAKYSTASHTFLLSKLKGKYSQIGEFSSGRVLSRQIWAVTPSQPTHPANESGLQSFCTCDNGAFWSESFSSSANVAGAVQARPSLAGSKEAATGGRSPLELLIRRILVIAGVELRSSDRRTGTGN